MTEAIDGVKYKLNVYLTPKSYGKLFFIFLIVKLTFSTVTSFVVTMIDPNLTSNPVEKESDLFIFMMSVVVAPLIETFVFQLAVMEIGREFMISRRWLMYLSAILFGTAHFYNLIYALTMFFTGLIFAYSYLFIRNKYDIAKATLFVVSLHAVSNLVAFLNNNVFHFF
ncbi:CPBP family intramembrane glutamic endopeptidase [Olivibacter sp. CPCC 100613]|uniref:CPBP family intramembrane glutamic endopeptidase n=1 Tax=Olivibacter sp. CPCC 100613 TaxID=3079931 RepID=UPI002FF8D268